MSFSLRARVLALVFAINVLVFGLGGYLTLQVQLQSHARLQNDLTENLLATIRRTIQPTGLNVPRILEWPSWDYFEDALLVDDRLERAASGELDAKGIELNVRGRRTRDVRFDHGRALEAARRAIETMAPVEDVEGGRVVPIPGGARGGAWGAIWFRSIDLVDEGLLIRTVAQWFALSTMVLTLVTFFAMRRLVLDPIASLGEGARRVRAGELDFRLPEVRRKDEMADLVRSFNEMTSTVQGFNRRLEEEVRRATEQARQAEAAAMTQRRLAAMGELAAGIAHEINNPLGGLQNAVETLGRDGIEPAKRKRYLELLSTGLTRIGETVNRLRRFTPRHADFEPVDLASVVQDSLDLVRHRAERLGVTLVAPSGASSPVRGLRNEIGQAVLNLLANSLDALEEASRHGRIEVTLRRNLEGERPGVSLSVRDDGPGVAPQELARVQDLYYTTKEVGKGSGLGLPLVHSTLQKHGGSVHILSEQGRFFEVVLWFPLETAPDPREDRAR